MSPIKAENRHRYPEDWSAISLAVKDAASWRCQCRGECGRPNAKRHVLHVNGGACINRHGKPAADTGSRVVLTTAHLNHTPEDCRPCNLRAMCQACHLSYDAEHHAATRAATIATRKAAA